MYIPQGFPDMLGDQPGCSDTGTGLEVCCFLQHLPIVGLTRGQGQGRGGEREKLELLSTDKVSHNHQHPHPHPSRPG